MPEPNLSPMFRQWQAVKRDFPGVLLLFRMGDFYEMFGEDAEVGARELELTLTSREARKGQRIPMCGVPHHALQRYLRVLIKKGYRAAICDQMEDPRQAKGLVKREVTRVVSPGTLLEEELLPSTASNFLACIAREGDLWGLASVEVSTGEFLITEIPQATASRARVGPTVVLGQSGDPLPGLDRTRPGSPVPPALRDELSRLGAAEVVAADDLFEALSAQLTLPVTPLRTLPDFRSPEQQLREHFRVATLDGYGLGGLTAGLTAAASVLAYLHDSHRQSVPHLRPPHVYWTRDFMLLDAATRRNLELTATVRTGAREGSLLSLLDRTETPMGRRLLSRWLLEPLLDCAAIVARHAAVEQLVTDPNGAAQVGELLRGISDLERLSGRITAQTANARDVRALAVSLEPIPALAEVLAPSGAPLLQQLAAQLDPLADVRQRIAAAIADDPPALVSEGGLLRDGFSAELDELRHASRHGKSWMAQLETQEQERTGIKSLRVGFNRVFGYYIEVTRSNLHLVPDTFIRRQTMVNAERFITPELKAMEERVLGAEERAAALEYELFGQLRAEVAEHAERLLGTAAAVAAVDVLLSFARLATAGNYVRPEVDDSDVLGIEQGRHPVVERSLPGEAFVPNDAHLDCEHNTLLIITGPNMAGKSTYLRQVALICLLAQIGSFVPARRARVGLVDRIFTRVGALDDLASGQSTFMVEMSETAAILNHATSRSLVILDEIGRGTSTFDGLSIAWATAEYLVRHLGAKTLFATHYHHLNELAEVHPGVRNFRVTVREEGDDVIFLRRIVPGGTDRSYGIQVARLAGLPSEVIERAQEVLAQLEQEDLARGISPTKASVARVAPPVQLQLFEAEPHPVVAELRTLDPNAMTPIEALQKLQELRGKAGP